MATIEELCKQGDVVRLSGVLKDGEMPMRMVYIIPDATEWMRSELPSIQTDGVINGALTPSQQAYQLMRDFVLGRDLLATDWFPKPLKPKQPEHGIWELRTPDLRFFGWFVSRGVFVISKAVSAHVESIWDSQGA